MQYVSTRGTAPALGFADALLAGLARDGGLYAPLSLPEWRPDDIRALRGLPYAQAAVRLMSAFIGADFGAAELEAMTLDAYAGFRHAATAPLVQIEPNLFALELFHGPTLAFKDFAMQWLGRAMDRVLTERGERATILGATSGDTGAAAIEAFGGLKQTDVFILYPHGRVSDVQRRQMTTVGKANVRALAIDGTFDDCQRIVKELFGDLAFRDEMSLSGVNSINWARILAQIVYYFVAAVALGAPERTVSFAVPTGNFGDILAGYYAKRMGLPIERLIIATNENDILARTLASGRYEPRGVKATQSPSMDIQVSSNFERLLFEASGQDPETVLRLMARLRLRRLVRDPAGDPRADPRRFRRRAGRRDGVRRRNDASVARLRGDRRSPQRRRRGGGASRPQGLAGDAHGGARHCAPRQVPGRGRGGDGGPPRAARSSRRPHGPARGARRAAERQGGGERLPSSSRESAGVSVRATTLPSGLAVVTDASPHVLTAAVGVFVAAGSRHESVAEHGLSHLLEHMAFKGTRRRNAREIAEAIEDVGGDLNAETGVERTGYFARLIGTDVGLALDVIGDILTESLFDPGELEREKNVIVQEIGAVEDTPDDLRLRSHDGVRLARTGDRAADPRHPRRGRLLRPRGDRPLSAPALRRLLDRGRRGRRGRPRRDPRPYGRAPRRTAGGVAPPPAPAAYRGGETRLKRKLEQTHVVVGFEGRPIGAPDHDAAHVFAAATGGGMSSRLFQEVREKRGLAYSIYSFHWDYSDTGLFGFYAGSADRDAAEVVAAALDCLAEAAHGIGDGEVRRAKAQMKVSILSALELPAARAQQLARQIQVYGRPLSLDEMIARVEAISADDVRKAGAAMLRSPPRSLRSAPSRRSPAKRGSSRR